MIVLVAMKRNNKQKTQLISTIFWFIPVIELMSTALSLTLNLLEVAVSYGLITESFYLKTISCSACLTECTVYFHSVVMTGSYNNFFRMFDRNTKRDITLEASRENNKPRTVLKPRKVCASGKRKKDEISVDSLDFNKKILHTAWHPKENIIAVATTNNLYIFQDKVN